MKRLFASALAAALLLTGPIGLAGCATIGAPPGPIVSTAGTTQDEKRLFDAELAYNVPARAYLAADARGQLPASVKPQAKAALQKALKALKAARIALQAANAPDFATQLAEAMAFTAAAKALVGGR